MKADMHKLNEAMARSGMLQKNLADKAGLSRRTVTTVCNGRRVRHSTMYQVAHALGVDVTEIMAEEV